MDWRFHSSDLLEDTEEEEDDEEEDERDPIPVTTGCCLSCWLRLENLLMATTSLLSSGCRDPLDLSLLNIIRAGKGCGSQCSVYLA